MQLSPKFEQKISDSFVETIEIAAPLCDLGNVAIPTNILQKKDRLTDDEIKLIQTHTTVGARILNDIKTRGDYNDFVQMSTAVAHNHHERWDGSAYPNKLKENEIPLSAQIVAVAGAYCSITESRIYRDAYDIEAALNILELESGRNFNPDIVDICKKIYRQFH